MSDRIEWKFKENAPVQGSSDGFWYDINYGGYIIPEDVLADEEQIKKFYEALDIVNSFETALESNGLLEDF